MSIKPVCVTGVSGGVLSAAAWIGDRETDLRELMIEAFQINDSHLDAGKSRLTPHQEIYRAVVATTLDDDALFAIANGPRFEAILSSPPRFMPVALATFVYGALYKTEQTLVSTPHLRWTRRAGLEGIRIDARQAARDGKLVDLICMAASIPPIFSVRCWDERRVMDGGFFEKACLPRKSHGDTLVLLSSRYRNLPDRVGVTYAQPSRPVAADKIDFTDASKVRDTWDQGVADAKAWVKSRV